jgi:hypothetical protein
MQVFVKESDTFEGVTYAKGLQSVDAGIGARMVLAGFCFQARHTVGLFAGNVLTGFVSELTPGDYSFSLESDQLALSTAQTCGLLPVPGQTNIAGDAGNGKVLNMQIPAFAPFYGARLMYLNYDTAAVMAIDGAYAAAAQYTGAAGASQNNSALTFTQVKFNGFNVANVPQATVGAGGQIIPGVLLSDFVQVTSVVRTDGATKPPLLRIATHFAPSANPTVHPGYNGGFFTNFNVLAANPGFNYGNNAFTSSLAAMVGAGQPTFDIYGGASNPIAAVFYYDTHVYGGIAFGDSLVQGFGTSTNYNGWPEYATWQSYSNASGFPISFSNFATSGQKSADTFAILKATIAQYKPEYALFKAWSPNDGDTQAIFNASWGLTIDAIEYCRQNNVKPVVLTSSPANGYTWSRIAAQNAKVLALPPWVKKVDVAAITNNPASPGTIKAEYSSGDGTHLNDACHAAIATAAINSIRY